MGYSLDPISDNCYPGTTILINRFNIQNQDKLDEIEGVITATRIAEWLGAPHTDTFDFSHYKQIHRYVFSDLYDWAGTIRTVNIGKKGTLFCPAVDIENQAERIFKRIAGGRRYYGLSLEQFADELVDLYCTTNFLHPFREGNGRTQRVFLSQLAEYAGYALDFSGIDTDLLMMATIQSAQGITDVLQQILHDAIKPLKK